jgi:glycosyltransferase involved in cell wall biosynthesis
MKMNSSIPTPIVTIIVITYNSSKYILETLESSKNQSYKNIELIISDDGSTDDTVELCEEWVSKNRFKFVNVAIIRAIKNSGIPGNCNRGVKASKGEWIKLIAGDDILCPSCIEEYVKFSSNSKESFYFSRFLLINELGNVIDDTSKSYVLNLDFFTKDPAKQYVDLIFERYLVPTPTSFVRKKTLLDLGAFDEEIPLCEDYPLWLRATKSGSKLVFLDRELVQYRIYPESVSKMPGVLYKESLKKIFFKYRFKMLVRYAPVLALDLAARHLVCTRTVLYKFVKVFLPYSYVNFFKKRT